ncbi:MAG: MaoC family dehydratase, partial [Burkholderiaceae bacterium]|nr:MaoC family dehydratase [Burkholderiaceae bacterium]
MTTVYARLADLHDRVGEEIGVSDWIVVDQRRIDLFAEATGDHQWIHVDPVRAAQGPFGAIPEFAASAFDVADSHMGVNYGLERVRFTAPVPAGSRVRGHFKLLAFEPIAGGAQLTTEVTVEREG